MDLFNLAAFTEPTVRGIAADYLTHSHQVLQMECRQKVQMMFFLKERLILT